MKLTTTDFSTIKGTKAMIKYAESEIREWQGFIKKAKKELRMLEKAKWKEN